MKNFYLFLSLFLCLQVSAQIRQEIKLEEGWKFTKGDFPEASKLNYNDKNWESVSIPHDWAIYGPFDRKYDLQEVAIMQNGEKVPTVKTGRTGGLPYIGVGWYRTNFDVEGFQKNNHTVNLLFDGAMSEARVYVNGKEVCFWPYGYNAFHCDVTDVLSTDGKNNVIAVRLENRPESSRWYPGAGLYRNVHVIKTEKTHIPIWGTYISTPFVSKEYASIRLQTKIENSKEVRVVTEIKDASGKIVATKDNTQQINHGRPFEQNFIVNNPNLWSPESPYLYTAISKVFKGDQLTDEYKTTFGIRDIKIVADKGFFFILENSF